MLDRKICIKDIAVCKCDRCMQDAGIKRIWVIISPQKICDRLPEEVDMLDKNVLEAIYLIRALRAAIEIGGKMIQVEKPNKHGQIHLDKYKIEIDKECYTVH